MIKTPWMQLGAAVLAAPLCASLAHADPSISYTYSSGSGDYSSHALEGSIDIGKLPLEASFDALKAKSAGAPLLDQYGLGLKWQVAPAWSLNYRFSNLKDDLFNVDGHEAGASLNLEKWWGSELETRLDLGAAAFDYSGRGGGGGALIPDQRRYSLGLRQDVTDSVTVYGTYDKFHYTRDPVALARALLKKKTPRVNAAFTLVAFPDRTVSYGVNWAPTQKVALDLSLSRTDSVLGQKQDSVKAALTYSFSRQGSVTFAYSQSKSSAVLRPNGTLLLDKDQGSNFELGFSWWFD